MTNVTDVYQLVKEVLEKEFVVPDFVKDKVWNEIEFNKDGLILSEATSLPKFKNYH